MERVNEWKPGREMDKAIAERVMGLHVKTDEVPIGFKRYEDGRADEPVTLTMYYLVDDDGAYIRDDPSPLPMSYGPAQVPMYSTNIVEAWEALERYTGLVAPIKARYLVRRLDDEHLWTLKAPEVAFRICRLLLDRVLA